MLAGATKRAMNEQQSLYLDLAKDDIGFGAAGVHLGLVHSKQDLRDRRDGRDRRWRV